MRILDAASALLPSAAPPAPGGVDVPGVGGGQATAQALGRLGAAGTDASMQAYQRAVEMSRKKAEEEAKVTYAEFIAQGLDGPQGIKQQMSMDNAKGSMDVAMSKFAKLAKEQIDQYDDPVIRQRLSEISSQYGAQVQGTMADHEVKQTRASAVVASQKLQDYSGQVAMQTAADAGEDISGATDKNLRAVQSAVYNEYENGRGITPNTVEGRAILEAAAKERTAKVIQDYYLKLAEDKNANKAALIKHIPQYASLGFLDMGDERTKAVLNALQVGAVKSDALGWAQRTAPAVVTGPLEPREVERRMVAALDAERKADEKKPETERHDSTWYQVAREALVEEAKFRNSSYSQGEKDAVNRVAVDLNERTYGTTPLYASFADFKASPGYKALNTDWGRKEAEDLWHLSKSRGGGNVETLAGDVARVYFNELRAGRVSSDLPVDEALAEIGDQMEKVDPTRARLWKATVATVKNSTAFGKVDEVATGKFPAYQRARSGTGIQMLETWAKSIAATATMANKRDKAELEGAIIQIGFAEMLQNKDMSLAKARIPEIARQAAQQLQSKLDERFMASLSSRDEAAGRAKEASGKVAPPPAGWIVVVKPGSTELIRIPVPAERQADFETQRKLLGPGAPVRLNGVDYILDSFEGNNLSK